MANEYDQTEVLGNIYDKLNNLGGGITELQTENAQLKTTIAQQNTKITGLETQYKELVQKIKAAGAVTNLPAQLMQTGQIDNQTGTDTPGTFGPINGAGYIVVSTYVSEPSYIVMSGDEENITIEVDGVKVTQLSIYQTSHSFSGHSAYHEYKIPFAKSICLSYYQHNMTNYRSGATYSLYQYVL